LRYVGFSHFEADECGALNAFLAAVPRAEPACGQIAAMVSVSDYADRPPRALDDGETISLGTDSVRWLDTRHLPHAWACGFLMETASATLLCGDLFTQSGARNPPLTEGDILGPSEAFRHEMDNFSHTRSARAMLERLAALQPTTLAYMHGSAWHGDGAALSRARRQRRTLLGSVLNYTSPVHWTKVQWQPYIPVLRSISTQRRYQIRSRRGAYVRIASSAVHFTVTEKSMDSVIVDVDPKLKLTGHVARFPPSCVAKNVRKSSPAEVQNGQKLEQKMGAKYDDVCL
jgi:glyoxylase-like metal-dependent hydrolase (beta-lactamase superfamily II)